MPQRATIESIPQAFSVLKQMRAQEMEWGQDYREAGALALRFHGNIQSSRPP